jgi:hypothetical protein
MITRDEILANALRWPFRSVPYAQWGTASPTGHRPDCSGYVSMCLGLPAPGLNTVSLRSLVDPITVSELQPGDLLGNLGAGTADDAGHVQLFEGWAPGGGVIVLEQNGIGPGPQRNTFPTILFQAWRFRGVATTTTNGEDEVKLFKIANDDTVWVSDGMRRRALRSWPLVEMVYGANPPIIEVANVGELTDAAGPVDAAPVVVTSPTSPGFTLADVRRVVDEELDEQSRAGADAD